MVALRKASAVPLAALLFALAAGCGRPAAPVVALTTDFGESDFYVGALKGAILAANPKARIIDVSHQIPKFDVEQGANTLRNASEVFPPGTIFVTVVDPGVGTARRPIVARLKNGHVHVAPDNGVLSEVVAQFGLAEARLINNRALMRGVQGATNRTFHGRDIFGPIAGHLAAGTALSEVGPEIGDLELFRPEVGRRVGGVLRGRIRTVDGYGNALSNIALDTLTAAGWPQRGTYLVTLAGQVLEIPLEGTYGDVELDQPVLVVGSSGFLELALNQADFAARYGVQSGDRLEVAPLR